MSQHHTRSLPARAACAPLMGAQASAQPIACDRHAHAAIGGGPSRAKDDDARVTRGLPGAGLQPLGIQHQGRHWACRFVGGHQPNRYGGALGHFKRRRHAKNTPTCFGQGGFRPMTQADPCTGGTSARLITCLQPDRRVVIELTGPR